MHGEQLLIASCLDDALAGVVYHYGTLLGLFVSVAADVDECFDDIVEGVVVIIVDYQFATAVVKEFDILFFFLFVFLQGFVFNEFVGFDWRATSH